MAATWDLVVIGAGWHGLVAAKTYLELHSQDEVLVLEAESTCGGTWSASRLYPGLKSNNLLDTYEYPDFAMSTDTYGIQPGQHIDGAVLHRYLTDFAKRFGVFQRTRFNTKVEQIEPRPEAWRIETTSENGSDSLETKKIIVATGLTSQPNFPQYAGAEAFESAHFHAKEFAKNGETVKTANEVVIVGGAKSAYDVAYAYAVEGVKVHLVIRENGNGPVWISYPWVLGGKKRLEKLLSVRFLTWFSPCPFGGVDGWQWVRNMLHGTTVGRFLVDKFWASLGGEVIDVNGYKKQSDLQKLEPWNPAFWIGSGLSIHNYDQDFFEMVRQGKIEVHSKTDVERLTKRTVHLSNGESLNADVLVCATGWKKEPSMQFANFGTAGIGLPHTRPEQAKLATEYDEKILSLYPRLRKQPPLNFKPKNDPYRMYRFIVPPARINDRNIAFAGMVSSVSTAAAANAQALWISAYFDGKLDHIASTPEEVTDEVMLHTQWGRWRYPTGYGASLPDFVFDALPYIDLLVKDLGLKVNRKASLFAEIWHPYGPQDWIGLVDEWRASHTEG